MRQALFCSVALLVIAAGRWGDAASLGDFQVFSLANGPTTLLPGRLYEPPAAATGPRPLILFLHGAGESGTNNSLQVNGNIDNLLAEAKRRGAYLYAPQTNIGWSSMTATDRVKSMLDRALAEKNVDASRIYVTGLSMGGGGTWDMLNRHGDIFAAGVPICAVFPGSDYLPSNLLDEPIWAFHARSDTTVSVEVTRAMFNSILAEVGEPPPTYLTLQQVGDPEYSSASLDVKFTDYRAGGHGIWARVYNTPAMYNWLFSFTSVPEPTGGALAAIGVTALILRQRARRDA